jgi:hypothetical protein
VPDSAPDRLVRVSVERTNKTESNIGVKHMKTQPIARSLTSTVAACSLASTLTLFPCTSEARGDHGGRGESRGFNTEAWGHEAPHESRSFQGSNNVHQSTRSQIQERFDRLNHRFADGSHDGRSRHDRIARTREFLFDELDFGIPDWIVGSWADALAQDEILDGMPSELVLDYWGNPVLIERIVRGGRPGEVWTFHPRPGRTTEVTVFNHRVSGVHRVS